MPFTAIRPRSESRWAFAGLSAYWLFFTWRGLTSWFTSDDALNLYYLHGVLTRSWVTCLSHAFIFPSSDYRPLGGAVYVLLYRLFGLNPLPYRVVCFMLLAGSLFLAWRLFRELSQSEPVAWIATLIFCYHAAETELFMSTGMLYDILCFPLYAIALLTYLRMIREGRAGVKSLVVLVAATALALNAKEMAITIPAALLATELFLRGRHPHGRSRRVLGIVITAAMVAVFLAVKTHGSQAITLNPLYRPHLSLRFVSAAVSRYLDMLVYKPGFFTPLRLSGAAAIAILVAFLVRRPAFSLGLAYSAIMIVPVAVIAPRGGFVLYIPMLGVALAVACGVTAEARSWMGTRHFFLMLIGLAIVNFRPHSREQQIYRAMQDPPRDFVTQLASIQPRVTPGATMLFLDDPFSRDDFVPIALVHLLYRLPDLVIIRAKRPQPPPTADYLTAFKYVIDEADGHLTKVAHQYLPAPAPNPPALPVRLTFTPASVHPGQPYRVSVNGFERHVVDVRFRYDRHGATTFGVTEAWCFIDKSGAAALITPVNIEPGRIAITQIRAIGSDWKPAQGALDIESP